MHSPRRFALAGTLDEYGDIRSRPSAHATRTATTESRDTRNSHTHRASSSPGIEGGVNFLVRDNTLAGHEFDTDMFQWPFIDGSWSLGFDAGLDGLWSNSGLFDPHPPLR